MNSDKHIRLSVLIPVYGVEQHIAACARSLFSQSVRDSIEFIFVDDASPDGSVGILQNMLAEYPERIGQTYILHHAENRGLAAARRSAIDAARGEWILHVDSDDILLPGAAAALLAASHPDTDLVLGDYTTSAHPETERGTKVRTPQKQRRTLLRILLSQSHRITNRTWGILIRRTLCTANNIYPIAGINFAEDYAVMPRLLYAARHVTVLRQAVYGYRLARTGSYMQRLDARAAAQYVAANRVVTDYMKSQNDYSDWRESVILSRLNIQKWLLRRGLNPQAYDAQLFYDGDRPHRPIARLYAAAIDSGKPLLARMIGLIVKYLP